MPGAGWGLTRRWRSNPARRVARTAYYVGRAIAANTRRASRRGYWSAVVVDEFSRLYYENPRQTWFDTRFLGVRVWKNPLDLWVYQELCTELRPDLIVETGTAFGGSALYLATLCDLLGTGSVVTIDIVAKPQLPAHPRITYLHGSSTDPAIVSEVVARAAGAGTVLVILDSDHRRDHVLAELRAYAPIVTPGSYVIVEDTNINGHPVKPRWGPGPWEAVTEYVRESDQLVVDEGCEKFFSTFNPRGYLRRVPAQARSLRDA